MCPRDVDARRTTRRVFNPPSSARSFGHRAALRDPIFFARRSIDRSLPPNARGGSTEGGRVAKPRVRAASRVTTSWARAYRLTLCVVQRSVRRARVSRAKKRSSFRVEYQYSPSDDETLESRTHTAKPRKKSKSANQRFPATGAATVYFHLYLRFITQRPCPMKRRAREKF